MFLKPKVSVSSSIVGSVFSVFLIRFWLSILVMPRRLGFTSAFRLMQTGVGMGFIFFPFPIAVVDFYGEEM